MSAFSNRRSAQNAFLPRKLIYGRENQHVGKT